MFIPNGKRNNLISKFRKEAKQLEREIDNRVEHFLDLFEPYLVEDTMLYLEFLDKSKREFLELQPGDLEVNLNNIDLANKLFREIMNYEPKCDEQEEKKAIWVEYVKEQHDYCMKASVDLAMKYYCMTGDTIFRNESKMVCFRLTNKFEKACDLVLEEQGKLIEPALEDIESLYRFTIFQSIKGYEFEGIGTIDTLEDLPKLRTTNGNFTIKFGAGKEEVSADDKHKSLQLYDYRSLNRLAKRSGFSKVRQKGDHGIFKSEDGTVAVIPQGRSVGKGLSCKIQKTLAK